jgi:gliding motility-associated-like protein
LKYTALFLCLLLGNISAFAQLSFQSGEEYLPGVAMKKIVITHNDRTAWAISGTGQVYFKRLSETNFTLYTHTIGEVVDDLSGYDESEMYFSVKPKKLILVKNNTKQEIVLSDPEITDIRNIAVVLDGAKHAGPNYYDNIELKDWLAIATDKYLYMILKGETVSTRKDLYRQPNFDIRDYTIVRNGIKAVEFKAAFSSSFRCPNWESDYSVIRTFNLGAYHSVIPDKGQFSDIRCTLFDYQSTWSSDWALDFWGTDQALYVKHFGMCRTENPIKTLINGKINSLDAIYSVSSFKLETFAIAATDNGFYYTPIKIYADNINLSDLSLINFVPFSPLDGIKVNNLYTEYSDFKAIDEVTNTMPLFCEKVVWLATDQGIKKLYVMYDGKEFEEKLHTDVFYDKTPTIQTSSKLSFDLCANDQLQIYTGISPILSGPLLIQWFKNGIEVPDLVGMVTVTLTEPGDYEARFTALCEGVTKRSQIFSLQFGSTAPEVTFNYPSIINLCEGQTQRLSTINKSGYTYRWLKDGVALSTANTADFTVDETGKYRVEVSNCSGSFVSSPEVLVNVHALAKPVLQADKVEYCTGEVPELKISSANGNRIKWYLEGVEQIVLQNQETIRPTVSGNYSAAIVSVNDCEKRSDVFALKINVRPVIAVTKNPDRLLCYGERTTLSVPLVAGYKYIWSDGNNTASTVAASSGAYSVTVTNTNGCSSTSLPVSVVVNSQIALSSPAEGKLCTYTGEELTLIADPGYKFYTWDGIRTTDNRFNVNTAGDHQVTIEDAFGCKASTVFKVVPWCNSIVVYSAFSPNGDGNNDLWRIGGLESDPGANVLIYNRFGILLHHAKGNSAHWDGKVKGSDAPAGVYYYVITSKQSATPVKGSVMLIR